MKPESVFHFSERGDIARFEPRPVAVPAPRAAGMDWLNGPLVWAIDDWHQPMYLFPRDCPRILVWPTATTTPQDLGRYRAATSGRMIAYIERAWLEPLSTAVLYRYAFSTEGFESLDDAGMWVSRTGATPSAVRRISDLPVALVAADVELRAVEGLGPVRGLHGGSLHVSAIRLRNMGRPEGP